MWDYVILDLDGTLYKKKGVIKTYLSKFAKINELTHDAKDLRALFDKSIYEIINSGETFSSNDEFWLNVHRVFLRKMNLPEEKYKELDLFAEEAKAEALLDIKPREHLYEFLETARESGAKIIVFTGGIDMQKPIRMNNEYLAKQREFKEKQLKILGVYELTDRLILTREYGSTKPDQVVFERLLQDLNTTQDKCVMIGDSYEDIAARQVGIKTILIDDGEEKSKSVYFEPDYIASDFKQVREILFPKH